GLADDEEGDREADEAGDAVDEQARADEAALARLDGALGVEADEAAGFADLVHDGVAGVDAVHAANALELVAVADVDAGRADLDAAEAVDAVAGGRQVLELAAGLAAADVVLDVVGVLV